MRLLLLLLLLLLPLLLLSLLLLLLLLGQLRESSVRVGRAQLSSVWYSCC